MSTWAAFSAAEVASAKVTWYASSMMSRSALGGLILHEATVRTVKWLPRIAMVRSSEDHPGVITSVSGRAKERPETSTDPSPARWAMRIARASPAATVGVATTTVKSVSYCNRWATAATSVDLPAPGGELITVTGLPRHACHKA